MDHDDQRLRTALETIAQVARKRVARHPLSHLAGGTTVDPAAALNLSLRVPLAERTAALRAAAQDASQAVDAEVEALVAHGAAFRPGRMLCLRCASTQCEHAQPPSPREVFVGYGPTGQPRYLDLPQWLLEHGDPRVDRLYANGPPGLVALTTSGRDLARQLLPAFRDRQIDYRIHGQVVAGWFRIPGRRGEPALQLALTFQIVSSATTDHRRRLGLNILGSGPDATPLQPLVDRLRRTPWADLTRAAQHALADIESAQDNPKSTPERLSARIEGVLNSLGRRLERDRRAESRRTHHAQERHQQGRRPTAMAHADASRAADADILVDRRKDTLIVVGERGRAHVFSRSGKHVTSIRATPESVASKRARKQWRPARADEIATLRKHVPSIRATR